MFHLFHGRYLIRSNLTADTWARASFLLPKTNVYLILLIFGKEEKHGLKSVWQLRRSSGECLVTVVWLMFWMFKNNNKEWTVVPHTSSLFASCTCVLAHVTPLPPKFSFANKADARRRLPRSVLTLCLLTTSTKESRSQNVLCSALLGSAGSASSRFDSDASHWKCAIWLAILATFGLFEEKQPHQAFQLLMAALVHSPWACRWVTVAFTHKPAYLAQLLNWF